MTSPAVSANKHQAQKFNSMIVPVPFFFFSFFYFSFSTSFNFPPFCNLSISLYCLVISLLLLSLILYSCTQMSAGLSVTLSKSLHKYISIFYCSSDIYMFIDLESNQDTSRVNYIILYTIIHSS